MKGWVVWGKPKGIINLIFLVNWDVNWDGVAIIAITVSLNNFLFMP